MYKIIHEKSVYEHLLETNGNTRWKKYWFSSEFEIPFFFFSLSLGESWSVEIVKRDLRTRPIPIFIKGTDEVKKDM